MRGTWRAALRHGFDTITCLSVVIGLISPNTVSPRHWHVLTATTLVGNAAPTPRPPRFRLGYTPRSPCLCSPSSPRVACCRLAGPGHYSPQTPVSINSDSFCHAVAAGGADSKGLKTNLCCCGNRSTTHGHCVAGFRPISGVGWRLSWLAVADVSFVGCRLCFLYWLSPLFPLLGQRAGNLHSPFSR